MKAKKEVKDDKSSSGSSSSSSSGSSSSGSDSDSDSDSSGEEGQKSDEDSDAEEEQEVVKKGELPKKYAFLALPHEEKTPQQRRWKWVKFENLPEDMKPFIRPPSKSEAKKVDRSKPKTTAAADKAEEEEQVVDIIDDRDLDYSKQENVDNILNKYKNQQISRRTFDPEFQIGVLQLILKAQENNKTVKIEVLMLLIATYFASAKNAPNGFFERSIWIQTSEKISELLGDLQSHNIDLKKQNSETKKEDGADLDTFLSSGDSQILPAIVTFIDKLDQQLFKSFQTLN